MCGSPQSKLFRRSMLAWVCDGPPPRRFAELRRSSQKGWATGRPGGAAASGSAICPALFHCWPGLKSSEPGCRVAGRLPFLIALVGVVRRVQLRAPDGLVGLQGRSEYWVPLLAPPRLAWHRPTPGKRGGVLVVWLYPWPSEDTCARSTRSVYPGGVSQASLPGAGDCTTIEVQFVTKVALNLAMMSCYRTVAVPDAVPFYWRNLTMKTKLLEKNCIKSATQKISQRNSKDLHFKDIFINFVL